MSILEGQRSLEHLPSYERPTPRFEGTLVTPDMLMGKLPDGKKAIATFNSALLVIPNKITGKNELIGVYRVSTEEHKHVEGKADVPSFFGVQRFALDPNGLTLAEPTFTEAASVLAVGDENNSPEDLRLSFDPEHQIHGALTEAITMTREELNKVEGYPYAVGEENSVTTVPLVATTTGRPTYDDVTGSITDVEFDKAHLAYEMVDGEDLPRRLVGKNAWVEYKPNGMQLLRYRPEFTKQDDGTVDINRTHVRTLIMGDDGYWHRIPGGEGIYSTGNLTDLIPEGNSLVKFGLNGRSIKADGKAFRIDHVASESTDPSDPTKKIVEYGFITVNGQMKPLLSFDDAVEISGMVGEDLTGVKRVIYCNGYAVIDREQPDGSMQKEVVMPTTFYDEKVGIFTFPFAKLSAYATGDGDTDALQRIFPEEFPTYSRRERPAA